MPLADQVRVRWRLSALLVAFVLVLGLTCSWAVAAAVDRQQQARASVVMDQRVEVIANAVTAQVRRYVDTSTDLAAALGAQRHLSAASFAALTSTLQRKRLPGVSGIGLVVPSTARDVSRTQAEWRARGSRGLTLLPAGKAREHLFGVLSRPLDGSRPRNGLDLSQAPQAAQALAAARSRNRVTASVTYVLLRDRALPASQQQQSFLLATPVYAGLDTPHRGRFEGWLVLGMRGRDFIRQTMREASQRTVAVTLRERSEPASPASVTVAQVGDGRVVDDPALRRTASVRVAGRTWQLLVRPTTRFTANAGTSLGGVAGGVGVAFTVLLAVLVGTLATSRSRALAKVQAATADLRADIVRREQVEALLRQREEELNLLALTDSLTGLANRRAFMDRLDQSHARAIRNNRPVCVLFCDVDHFKAINDTYGHAAGDGLLRAIAERLVGHFRSEDTVGRLGGDEFAVICEDASSVTQSLLDRLHDVLAAPYTIGGETILATVSIGMATPCRDENSAQLLDRADRTMYLAKAARHAALSATEVQARKVTNPQPA